MNNVILDNAYGILGLLPNSTQKELSRRIKEIEKLLQIEETPEYPFDFNFYKNRRSLSNCKIAVQKISTSKTQILHYFFRVYSGSNKIETFLKDLEEDFCYEKILEYYNKNNSLNFIEKKNIAILLTILLLTEINTTEIDAIVNLNINIWKEIFESEKTYKDFKKIFLLDDELGVDESICDNIESIILEELTTIFSDIAIVQDNPNILAEFIKQFNLENKTFNIQQVEDIYKNIDISIQILKSMNISEDGIFDDNEKATVKKCLESFQKEFNKLIELNLYEHEKTLILRDLTATTIRLQILDLFNNLDEDEISLNLMKFAIYIAGTEGLKSKLNNELQIIEGYNNPIEVLQIDRNRKVSIYNKYFVINDKKITFDEVESIAYLLHTTRTNGIETERTYNFELGTKDELFVLTQDIHFFTNKKEAENIYYKLVSLANFIIPIIAEKLYASLQNNNILQIDKLYITKDHYYIRKWNGDKIVKIYSGLHKPTIKEGNVILYDEQGYSFFELSLNASNAPVLLELITLLINKNMKVDSSLEDFSIKPEYGLHRFYPELETESERKKILFGDFLEDLFGWICLLGGLAFVIFIIKSIFWGN